MSIFDTIISSLRSLVGVDTGEGESADRTAGQVSVERETRPDREAADASTESAVKGAAAGSDASASSETLVDDETGREPAEAVETAGEGDESVTPEADAASAEPEDVAAAGSDAAASTETLVDEATGKEPGETVAPTEAPEEQTAADEGEDRDEDDDEASVETLTGIGPAYGERLESIGIETVSDLAAADADEVAAEIDVSETRVTNWIEQARDSE
ncbi:MAG: helix-hairpin-helix domain-containing protein [Haloquadratum sp.]